jgi:hypothetical protein
VPNSGRGRQRPQVLLQPQASSDTRQAAGQGEKSSLFIDQAGQVCSVASRQMKGAQRAGRASVSALTAQQGRIREAQAV